MATLCDGQSLASASKCLVETFSRVELKAIRIVLLCNLINGTSMECDAQTLATASKCILEQMSYGDMEAAETYLVFQLNSSGGGGSGSAQIKTYIANPNTEGVVPGDVNSPAVAYAADGSGAQFGWDINLQVWA